MQHDPSQIEDDSLYEHYLRHRDPLEYFERGQIFTSLNQMTPVLLSHIAMGEAGKH